MREKHMRYIATSEGFAPLGTEYSAEDLAHLNVPALVAAGHLAEAPEEPAPPADDKEPED